jgi:CubicO group peptidase (beta-lactamase class C family)
MSAIAERRGTTSAAGELGFSESRLERTDALFEAFIERGVVAGAVTLVARKGRIAQLAAYGYAERESARLMRPDTMFRLASMTKPVISVAILMLLEEGKNVLKEPIANFIPSFRDQTVQVQRGDEFSTEPAQREVTIRDLLTHTGGFGSAAVGPAAAQMETIIESRTPASTLAEMVPRMAAVPLSFQPGTAWEYSGAPAFEALGHVVEIVSGQPLDQFLHERLFEPLGMRDTTFSVPSDKLGRVAAVYERAAGKAGELRAADVVPVFAQVAADPNNRYFSGGGGLVGTAEDYARFAMMLGANGELDGQRILGRKTVDLMASNHIGQLGYERTTIDLSGYRFGLGVRVLDTPADAATLASRGTFGWAGAFGTNSWIDRAEQMIGLMLIQRMPDTSDTVLRSLMGRFQNTTYQALE